MNYQRIYSEVHSYCLHFDRQMLDSKQNFKFFKLAEGLEVFLVIFNVPILTPSVFISNFSGFVNEMEFENIREEIRLNVALCVKNDIDVTIFGNPLRINRCLCCICCAVFCCASICCLAAALFKSCQRSFTISLAISWIFERIAFKIFFSFFWKSKNLHKMTSALQFGPLM